jgi:pyridoxine kinase
MDTKISSFSDLKDTFGRLHKEFRVSHVVVTSIRLADLTSNQNAVSKSSPTLSVVGSSRTSSGQPRAFRIDIPDIDCYFSGTGDMFAALLVARLREAVAHVPGLTSTSHWLPADATCATDLPLCHAVRKVLASMARILESTKLRRDQELSHGQDIIKEGKAEHDEKAALRRDLAATKAAEIRLVRYSRWLLEPELDFDAVEI